MRQPDSSDIGSERDVAQYRLLVAKEDLQAARVLVEANSYRGANNRTSDEQMIILKEMYLSNLS